MPKTPYHHGDLKNSLIHAAIEILAQEGVEGLSLRKAARRAGVSHAAPYAHFADKQALLAAISTEGYRRIYARIRAAADLYPALPLRRLIEGAWAYAAFAQEDPAHYRITLSGVVTHEKDYPELVQATAESFQLVVAIVADCQAAGLLRPAPPELMTVSVWSAVHGLVALALEAQISHTILQRYTLRRLLIETLGQFVQKPIPARYYPLPRHR